jgi:hypothetical protein
MIWCAAEKDSGRRVAPHGKFSRRTTSDGFSHFPPLRRDSCQFPCFWKVVWISGSCIAILCWPPYCALDMSPIIYIRHLGPGDSSVESVGDTKSNKELRTIDDTLTLARYGLERRDDGLVYWRPDSKSHPRNWPTTRKAFDTTIIILFEFYT